MDQIKIRRQTFICIDEEKEKYKAIFDAVVEIPYFESNIPYDPSWNDIWKLSWFAYQRLRTLDTFKSAMNPLRSKTDGSFHMTKEERKLRSYKVFMGLELSDMLKNRKTKRCIAILKEMLEQEYHREITQEELDHIAVLILEYRAKKEALDVMLDSQSRDTTTALVHFSPQERIKIYKRRQEEENEIQANAKILYKQLKSESK